MRARLSLLAVTILALGAARGDAQSPRGLPPPGRYELWVGSPGDRGDPASQWCELGVHVAAGRVVVVPSRVGSLMRCVEATVTSGGTCRLVLQRLRPVDAVVDEGGASEAEEPEPVVSGLDWAAWGGDGRSETWELVGHVEALAGNDAAAPVEALVGWAKVTVLEGGRGRAWRTRFAARPLLEGEGADDVPAAGVEPEDPELGGGWRAPLRRRPSPGALDRSWRPAQETWPIVETRPAGPAVPTVQPPPAQAGRETSSVALVALGVVLGVALAMLARSARLRRAAQEAGPAPPPPQLRPPRPATLREAARLTSFDAGLASLRGAGLASPSEPVAPAERTAPVDAVLDGPAERTAPVDAVLDGVERTAPVDAVLGGPVERTAPVDAVLDEADE